MTPCDSLKWSESLTSRSTAGQPNNERDELSNDQDDYVILEPGRLIVTHLHKGDFANEFSDTDVISVVRNLSVGPGSELYKPVAELTEGLKILFNKTDNRVEVTLFEVAA